MPQVPTSQDISAALSRMSCEKSPDPNGIPTEVFRNIHGPTYKELVSIITNFWTKPDFYPEDWSRCPNLSNDMVLPLVISLPNVSSILSKRLTKHIVTYGIDEQYGCLNGKRSTDATFTLKPVLQTL